MAASGKALNDDNHLQLPWRLVAGAIIFRDVGIFLFLTKCPHFGLRLVGSDDVRAVGGSKLPALPDVMSAGRRIMRKHLCREGADAETTSFGVWRRHPSSAFIYVDLPCPRLLLNTAPVFATSNTWWDPCYHIFLHAWLPAGYPCTLLIIHLRPFHHYSRPVRHLSRIGANSLYMCSLPGPCNLVICGLYWFAALLLTTNFCLEGAKHPIWP